MHNTETQKKDITPQSHRGSREARKPASRRFLCLCGDSVSLWCPRGSLTLEYAVLIAFVIAALIGMAAYGTRALCGRWRGVADAFGHGRQYEPGVTIVTR